MGRVQGHKGRRVARVGGVRARVEGVSEHKGGRGEGYEGTRVGGMRECKGTRQEGCKGGRGVRA